ncbi:MAG: hypothetical protein Q8P20_00475 [bacterium]|nr:hypothetical protein [bacterium]
MTEDKTESAQRQNLMPNLGNVLNTLLKQGERSEWWRTYNYTGTLDFKPDELINFARSALYTQAIAAGTVFESKVYLGILFSEEVLDSLIKELNGRLVYKFNESDFYKNAPFSVGLFYIFSDGAMLVLREEIETALTFVTLNESKMDVFNNHLKSQRAT